MYMCIKVYLQLLRSCRAIASVSHIFDPHSDDVRVGGLVHFTIVRRVAVQHGLEQLEVVLHFGDLGG